MPQSGLGGHVKVANSTVGVSEWQKESMMRLAETPVSTSTGMRRSNLLPDGTWTCSFPWETDQTPESVGLRRGADVALQFLLGASGKCYSFTGKVEKVAVVENVATDVLRCIVSGFAEDIGDPIAVP